MITYNGVNTRLAQPARSWDAKRCELITAMKKSESETADEKVEPGASGDWPALTGDCRRS